MTALFIKVILATAIFAGITYFSVKEKYFLEDDSLLKIKGLDYEKKNETQVKYASIKLNKNSSLNDAKKFIITKNDYNLTEDNIAIAKYTVGMNTIGWDLLAIKTNKNFDDALQAEAAGYLEGYLTRIRIYDHFRNLNIKNWKNKGLPSNTKEFFIQQKKFVDDSYQELFLNRHKTEDGINNNQYKKHNFSTNYNANTDDDELKAAVIYNAYLLNQQFSGLVNGYNENLISGETEKIEEVEFHIMSSTGDLFDLIYYKNPSSRPNFKAMQVEDIIMHIHRTNHCSALFKVQADLSDVYFGHNSWFYYSSLTRIFKEYNFNFKNKNIKSRNIIFSSYAASLASIDDFYITSHDLAIIETTNSLFDNNLYDLLDPKSLLTWQRAMIASRLADNAKSWVEIFAIFNSGTYNNQFMALDMKKVDLEERKIDDEALFIVEQIPGTCDINDVTEYLRYGYWPSYNTPYSGLIRELSKIPEMIKHKPKLRDTLDYDNCARANIFRRDQGKVDSEESFKKLIRYNDYKNDELSLGRPSYTVSARSDLERECMGAYDAKTTSISKAKGKNKRINIIIGPTNEQVPTFIWEESTTCKNDPRFGLPNKYDFGWYEYSNEFYDEEIYKNESEEFY